jgi:hypothetical protein
MIFAGQFPPAAAVSASFIIPSLSPSAPSASLANIEISTVANMYICLGIACSLAIELRIMIGDFWPFARRFRCQHFIQS